MRIHMIGVCGIAMGTLAQMLQERGHDITGSDAAMYPPMSDALASRMITLYDGYDSSHIEGAELVIIGNAVSRGNAEVEQVLNAGIPYMSMPRALHEFFLRHHDVVVVAGTHGKSTTTALLARMLDEDDMDPSFFVGGIVSDYGQGYRLGKGRVFLIEGDEYDSAFFEKYPKFMHYSPRHLLLTSLEHDHADIYPDFDSLKQQFHYLLRLLPSEGNCVYSSHYTILEELVTSAWTPAYSFGVEKGHCRFQHSNGGYSIRCDEVDVPVKPSLMGRFNHMNIAAATAMAVKLGVTEQSIRKAIEEFQGVARRMQELYRDDDLVVIEDFAHHPTAVAEVVGTIREEYPRHIIHAVYEPRSATSRRNTLADRLASALVGAQYVYIKRPWKPESIPASERIDIEVVVKELCNYGSHALLYDTVESIVEDCTRDATVPGKHVVIIMSNGGFDGIYEKMIAGIREIRGNKK